MNILSDSDLLVIAIVNGQPSGFPLTYSNFRMLYPQTSFPALPDNACLADFGYAVFAYVNPPSPVQFQHTTEGPIAWDDKHNAYVNTWIHTPFTPEQRLVAIRAQMAHLRQHRDLLLMQCDWTQLSDVVLSARQAKNWQTYRQALRDYMGTIVDAFDPPAFPVAPQ